MSCQSLHKQRPLYTRKNALKPQASMTVCEFFISRFSPLFENFCNSNKCKIQKSSWDASKIINYTIAVAMESLGGTKSSRFGVPPRKTLKNLLLPLLNILQLTSNWACLNTRDVSPHIYYNYCPLLCFYQRVDFRKKRQFLCHKVYFKDHKA